MWTRGGQPPPAAASPAATESTESDSDFGIEDIEDDVRVERRSDVSVKEHVNGYEDEERMDEC